AIAEAAEAESEALYLWLLRRSPQHAAVWYEGFLAAINSLADFPRRCPLARENALFDQEIRQLLYGKGDARAGSCSQSWSLRRRTRRPPCVSCTSGTPLSVTWETRAIR